MSYFESLEGSGRASKSLTLLKTLMLEVEFDTDPKNHGRAKRLRQLLSAWARPLREIRLAIRDQNAA